MRTLILATMALLPSSALLAQGSAKEQYDKLVADYTNARTEASAARQAVVNSAAYKAAAANRSQENQQIMTALLAEVPQLPIADLTARAQKSAKAFVGTEDAVQFLVWIVQRADGAAIASAVETLISDHIESDALVDVSANIGRMGNLLGAEKAKQLEQTLFDKSPNPVVKDNINTARARIAERAAGELFVAERLQIGMVAPDIEAPDLDGVTFKLSDYRGKVVVIDFWGDW